MNTWVAVTDSPDSLPASNRHVLAYYVNYHGKYRIVRAQYAGLHTLPLGDDVEGGRECGDCDGEFVTVGWYETNEHEDVNWKIDEEVTHWMPLPKPPTEESVSLDLPTFRQYVSEATNAVFVRIERLQSLASEIACLNGSDNHDHDLCHDIAKAMLAPENAKPIEHVIDAITAETDRVVATCRCGHVTSIVPFVGESTCTAFCIHSQECIERRMTETVDGMKTELGTAILEKERERPIDDILAEHGIETFRSKK